MAGELGLISNMTEVHSLDDAGDSFIEIIVPSGTPDVYGTRRISADNLTNLSSLLYDRRDYTATEGQTNFGVIYEDVEVYVDGVLLPEDDYTATNGIEIDLISGVSAGTIVSIIGKTPINEVSLPQPLADLRDQVVAAQGDLSTIESTRVEVQGYANDIISKQAANVSAQASMLASIAALADRIHQEHPVTAT